MRRVLTCIIVLLGITWSAFAQSIPTALRGKWVVRRVLPTTTISCWGHKETNALIGTELEYSSQVFRWQKVVTKNPIAEASIITAEQFHDQNSGMGTNSSQVTFKQLGIEERKVTQVVVRHPPASIAEGTFAIPGDFLLIKGQNTIVFSVCGVYFEATRSGSAPY